MPQRTTAECLQACIRNLEMARDAATERAAIAIIDRAELRRLLAEAEQEFANQPWRPSGWDLGDLAPLD